MKPITCDTSPRLGEPKRLFAVSSLCAAMAIAFMMLPKPALALGLGELKLNSGLGQPIAAEIELLGAGETLPEGECFRLAPGSDLETGYPWLQYGRMTLQRIDGKTKLLLSSTQPLWEPIIEIGVKIGCGVELSRRYTVLPAVVDSAALPQTGASAAPDAGAETTAAAKPVEHSAAPERQHAPGDWIAGDGESVRTLGRLLEPDNRKARLRLINAIGDANPELRNAGKNWYTKPLPAGTHVKMPVPHELQTPQVQAAKVAKSAAKHGSDEKTALPEFVPSAKSATPAKKAAPGQQDKLVLGSSEPGKGKVGTGTDRERELMQRAEEMKATMQRQDEELATAKNRMQQLEEQLTLLGDRAKMLDERLRILNTPAPTPPSAAATPAATSSGLGVGETALFALALVGLAGAAAYFLRRRAGGGDAESLARLSERRNRKSDTNKNKDITILDPFDERSVAGEGSDNGINVVHHTASAAMAKAMAKAKAVQAGTGKTSLSLDEEDAVVELADVLLSLSMSAHAVETLVAYIEANPKKAITPWLKLMKMYRETGRREDFDRLAGEIMTAFNVDRISWDDFNIGSSSAGVEQYQHIEKKLISCWGTDECLQYLKHLLADNREGTRSGFPIEVVNEILMLIGVLKTRETVLS